jgi:KaiC/GvpD/RAD55 family RecA-like ATPase/5S rRNA maturation endonuclease (ribonuclease M5)
MKFEDFVSRFEGLKKTSSGYVVKCPAHDDGSPSLSISRAKDGGVVLKCFAGCTAESVVSSLGLTMKDLFVSEPARTFIPPKKTTPKATTAQEKPIIEKVYSYQDATGKEVYQALRMKPKSFRQRHLVGGNWVWNMDGVERVLYRLPDILLSKTVWIVEGEKDADNLAALGFEATCNVGGAGKWLDGYTETLAGKDIVICGDNDEAGQKHVELVFNSLAGHAKTVRLVKLPQTVKDASDYISEFKTPEEAKNALQAICDAAHPHYKGIRLPLFTISELEASYRAFVRSMAENSFSLGRWLPSFNKLRPLVPGELVFIVGDTGTGKTALLQQIAYAALPLPTLMFEMELPQELMFERFAAMVSKNTCDSLERAYAQEEGTLIPELDRRLKNLYICTESKLTLSKIEEYILRSELKIGEKPKVVLIDYIQLIAGSGPNRRERMSDIAEGLKILAKSTRTIIIVSSQIARPPKDDTSGPGLHSAKESGSIEASCGLMLGAWRDNGVFKIKVLKSTKGGGGLEIPCRFEGATMTITELATGQNYGQDAGQND